MTRLPFGPVARRRWPVRAAAGLLLAASLATGAPAGAQPAGAPPTPGQLAQVGNDPLRVVESLYAALQRGDLDRVRSMVAPDVRWTYHGPSHALPFAGTFRGPDGVRNFAAREQAALEATNTQPRLLRAGDHVTAIGQQDGVVKATGARYTARYVHLLEVRDNVVVSFDAHVDSGTLLEAFSPAEPARGRALFTTCVGCHGNQGQGRPELGAPNLTGLDRGYLTKQLRDYRDGRRGSPEDARGYQMVGRANALPGDRGVRDVVAYIATLPAQRSRESIRGDLQAGGRLYRAQCLACHGERAEGHAAQGAPALAPLQSWYLQTQLSNFRSGLRGAEAGDSAAASMRAAAVALGDGPALADVLAYILSLNRRAMP